MAFNDLFRMSCHAVITNNQGEVLLLKADYGSLGWGLPGGAIDPGETIHEALLRECLEELACDVEVGHLGGVYFHKAFNSHALIFRCSLKADSVIRLSSEHSEYRYSPIDELSDLQKKRVTDCLNYTGVTLSAKF